MSGVPMAIEARGLSKGYHLGKKHFRTLQESLLSLLKPSKVGDWFLALDDVSFDVKQGEILGIIGPNGAGKTTLLRLLSRITFPTHGRIEIHGRTSSLLEVGTGFHLELTGRENVYLNGTILGMSRKEIRNKFDEIVEFSGISTFIDTPAKRYSSGMLVRLAFSVAAHLNPEVLLLDEVLAVGDADFQKKCLGKMGEVRHQGKTILLVSHNMNHIQQLASKAILLDHGKIKAQGDPAEVVSRYLLKEGNSIKADLKNRISHGVRSEDFAFTSLSIESSAGQDLFETDEVLVTILFQTRRKFSDLVIGISITAGGQNLVECRSVDSIEAFSTGISEYEALVRFVPGLRAGVYSINLGAKSREGPLRYIPEAITFEIKPIAYKELWKADMTSIFLVNSSWRVSELQPSDRE